MSRLRRFGIRVGLLVSVLALPLVAACGQQHHFGIPPPLPAAPLATIAPAPTSTVSSQEQQILDRYTSYVRATERAFATHEIVELGEYADGLQYRHLVDQVVKDEARGVEMRGHLDIRPSVESIAPDGKSATIRDCKGDGTSQVVYSKTGKPVHSGRFPGRVSARVTMQYENGQWMVSTSESGKTC